MGRRRERKNICEFMKSGFDLESAQMTKHDRLSKLLTLINIPYAWVIKIEKKIKF